MRLVKYCCPCNLVFLFSFILLTFPSPGICQKDGINIHWTGTGITLGYLVRPPESLAHLTNQFEPVFDVPEGGRIIVRMPVMKGTDGRERFPSEAEWQTFTDNLIRDLSSWIDKAYQQGIRSFEIRTVEDINLGGYMDSQRQSQVDRFTRAFLEALMFNKERLAKDRPVECDAALGSNEVKAAAKVIPGMEAQGRNPISSAALYDGRASESDAELLIKALGERVSFINTAGDAPVSPLPPLTGQDLVASFDCTKRLKEKYHSIRVFFVADPIWPIGPPGPFKHIKMMNPQAVGLVKELLTGGGFFRWGKMTGGALISEASWTGKTSDGHPSDPSKIPKEKRPPEKKKKRQDEYPPGPPPPPPPPPPPGRGGVAPPSSDDDHDRPPPGGPGGGGVGAGSSSSSGGPHRPPPAPTPPPAPPVTSSPSGLIPPGGIVINPPLNREGAGGQEMRDQTSKAQPGKKSGAWSIPDPMGGK